MAETLFEETQGLLLRIHGIGVIAGYLAVLGYLAYSSQFSILSAVVIGVIFAITWILCRRQIYRVTVTEDQVEIRFLFESVTIPRESIQKIEDMDVSVKMGRGPWLDDTKKYAFHGSTIRIHTTGPKYLVTLGEHEKFKSVFQDL